jgi:phosphatidylglycerophosphate synthase
LATLGVRPTQVTGVGVVFAVAAAMCLALWPTTSWIAAVFVAAAWFCDRTDGPLARLQKRTSPLGAWIDANVDECIDLGLHIATAATAAYLASSPWPWFWLIGFLVGKYLLMHGLSTDEQVVGLGGRNGGADSRRGGADSRRSTLRFLYHFPASADVRAHLLIAALATGWLTAELALLAVYYNLRWAARFALLSRRVAAARSAEVAT